MNREFSSCLGLADHAAELAGRERLADEHARGVVASRLTLETKMVLGNPTLLTPALAASTLARRARLGYGNTPLLMTGQLRRSISWAHTSSRQTGVGSSSPYAIYHELEGKIPGRPPQRSFLASTARRSDVVCFRLYGLEYRLRLDL